MRKPSALLPLLALLALSCGGKSSSPEYRDNDLELVTAYQAKELCSCLFVMGQTEDFCRRWTAQTPKVARYRIDSGNKRVEASALLLWGARAHFVDERHGCVLE